MSDLSDLEIDYLVNILSIYDGSIPIGRCESYTTLQALVDKGLANEICMCDPSLGIYAQLTDMGKELALLYSL